VTQCCLAACPKLNRDRAHVHGERPMLWPSGRLILASVATQVFGKYKRKIKDFCLKNIYSGKLVNILWLFTVPERYGVFVKTNLNQHLIIIK
jgi:hypothetical protein